MSDFHGAHRIRVRKLSNTVQKWFLRRHHIAADVAGQDTSCGLPQPLKGESGVQQVGGLQLTMSVKDTARRGKYTSRQTAFNISPARWSIGMLEHKDSGLVCEKFSVQRRKHECGTLKGYVKALKNCG